MRLSVVVPILARGLDLQFRLILFNGQLTGCRACQVVVLRDIRFAVLNGQSRRVVRTVIIRSDRFTAGRCVVNRYGLVVHQARYGLLAIIRPGPAVLLFSGVRQRTVRHGDRQVDRIDCQRA